MLIVERRPLAEEGRAVLVRLLAGFFFVVVVVERRPDELRVVAPVGVADLRQLIERDLHAHKRKEKW